MADVQEDRSLEKTRTPGVYRRGGRYVVIYRANGRQRKEFARTYEDARRLKRAREADRDRGELHEGTRLAFRAYAEEWVERYQGRGKGFRESTRDEYRRCLEKYAYPYFDERLRRTLAQITPRDVANFIAWLCDEREQGKRLTDSSVANIVKPVRAALGTAVLEGLIRHNPAQSVPLPHRPRPDEMETESARAFTREQLAAILELVHPGHRLLFRLLAATGLRISEAIALQWRHLALDGGRPHVKVRRALVRERLHPPKSRHGRRDVPLDSALVSDLRRHRLASEWPGDDHLVFPSLNGTALLPRNLRRRVLQPVAEEVGAPWAGFHTFRHTCASMLFERGANAVQVQRWLGHHSAAFTLATYVHLLADDLGEPLRLADELNAGIPAIRPAASV